MYTQHAIIYTYLDRSLTITAASIAASSWRCCICTRSTPWVHCHHNINTSRSLLGNHTASIAASSWCCCTCMGTLPSYKPSRPFLDNHNSQYSSIKLVSLDMYTQHTFIYTHLDRSLTITIASIAASSWCCWICTRSTPSYIHI